MAELEPAPAPLPAVDDDPVRRLVAAWLLGYASPATRRSYALDMTAWLSASAPRPRHWPAGRPPGSPRCLGPHPTVRRRRRRRGPWPGGLAAVSSWYRYLVAEGIRAASPRRARPPAEDRRPGRDPRPHPGGGAARLLPAAREHGSRAASPCILAPCAHRACGSTRPSAATSATWPTTGPPDPAPRAQRRPRRPDSAHRARRPARWTTTWTAAPTGPLFITRTGKRMGQPEAWKMIRRLAARAGLDGAGRSSRTRCGSRSSLAPARPRPPRRRPGRRRPRRPPHHPPLRPRPPLPRPARFLRPHHMARRPDIAEAPRHGNITPVAGNLSETSRERWCATATGQTPGEVLQRLALELDAWLGQSGPPGRRDCPLSMRQPAGESHRAQPG